MSVLDERLESLLGDIYGSIPPQLAAGLSERLTDAASRSVKPGGVQAASWSEADVVLITYADQIRSQDRSPLASLDRFLSDHDLHQLLRCVHLLPFCPYSSDDGFSVIDYLAVDPNSGTWDDIARLGEHTNLMFDLVLNHCSQHSDWFQQFLAGNPEYADFFVTADPADDVSGVTRPRSLPLLTPFETKPGTQHVWTTFSDDQVDLNYANPQVLLRMIDILIEYARRGARIIRLDAIAYLWKELGTSCIHLTETHRIVQVMRYVLDQIVPGTLILTETNVPHAENISYFGDGDEAHMVYQFSLPPLLLEAVFSGDTTLLVDWLRNLDAPLPGTTFFNFTASHDGIGLRPLEGLVPEQRVLRMVEAMRQRGGRVGMRRRPDGSDSPYELNITYVDAVADANSTSPDDHARRFLATQAIMLSLQGMPAVYFHSLVGSQGDQEAVLDTGINRRINRHKYDRNELNSALSDPDGLQRKIFAGYQRLLKVRINQPCFHPDARQDVIELAKDGTLGLLRTTSQGESIMVLANLRETRCSISTDVLPHGPHLDLLAPDDDVRQPSFELGPFQVRWLQAKKA